MLLNKFCDKETAVLYKGFCRILL